MHRVLNYAPIVLSITLIFFYFVLFYTIGYKTSKFLADSLAIGLVTFMAAVTLPNAWNALMAGLKTGPQRFVFSYWFVWTVIFFRTCLAMTSGLLGRPDWLLLGPIPGLIGILFAIAGINGFAAPLTGPDPIHRNLIITMTISGVIAGIAIGMVSSVYLITGFIE